MLVAALLLSACSVSKVSEYVATDPSTACPDGGASLGRVIVLPETVWRKDQKEPEKREAMAREAIVGAFAALPCGTTAPDDVLPFEAWSARPEAELLRKGATAGADTVIVVRVEELTPHLALSFPVLWSSFTEVDFRVRALRVADGRVLLDARRDELHGGAFAVRGAEFLPGEFEKALRSVLGPQPAGDP